MTETSSVDAATARDQLAQRLFGATIGALGLFHVWLGERLGLYQALAHGGPASAADLATRGGDQRAVHQGVARAAGGGRAPRRRRRHRRRRRSQVSLPRAMRALRAEGGTVLVADERVADEFTTEVEEGERFQWGWSALHCLPCALTEPPATGTGMRAPTFRRYALDAGFAEVEVLPVENDFWR